MALKDSLAGFKKNRAQGPGVKQQAVPRLPAPMPRPDTGDVHVHVHIPHFEQSPLRETLKQQQRQRARLS